MGDIDGEGFAHTGSSLDNLVQLTARDIADNYRQFVQDADTKPEEIKRGIYLEGRNPYVFGRVANALRDVLSGYNLGFKPDVFVECPIDDNYYTVNVDSVFKLVADESRRQSERQASRNLRSSCLVSP